MVMFFLFKYVLSVECLRCLLVNAKGIGIAFLPLTESIFSKAVYNCADPACRLEYMVGMPVMQICGHCKITV